MYELNIQIWPEDGMFFYSVIQEFRSNNSNRVEPIAYGQVETREEAASIVANEVRLFMAG